MKQDDQTKSAVRGSELSAELGARTQRGTIAEVLKPSDSSMVEFWCHRMSKQGHAGTGILGWFRSGLFWSYDNSDHYAPGEVTHWINARNAMRCAARGGDGCLVCAPNEANKVPETAARR